MNITQALINDTEALKPIMAKQLDQHFNGLLQEVPSIKGVEWTSERLDEAWYALEKLTVTKNNGYQCFYGAFGHDNYGIEKEFSSQEIIALEEFSEYLEASSQLLLLIYGEKTFILKNFRYSAGI